MRRGAWQVIVAAVVVAGVTVFARVHSDDGLVAAEVRAGYAANRAAAQQEVERVLDLVSLPPGAARSDVSPAAALSRPEVTSPTGALLIARGWWRVPAAPAEVRAWLQAHALPGLTRSDGSGTTVADDGTSVATLTWFGTGTAAYGAPQLLAEWTPMPGGTAVRFESWAAARVPRSAQTRIPEAVSGVVITRSITPTTGEHPRSQVVRRRLLDPAEMAQVVDALNTAREAPVTDSVSTGHGVDEMRLYRIRITWPAHVMVAEIDPAEDSELSLTLDGRAIEPQLEMSYRFAPMLDGLLQRP